MTIPRILVAILLSLPVSAAPPTTLLRDDVTAHQVCVNEWNEAGAKLVWYAPCGPIFRDGFQ